MDRLPSPSHIPSRRSNIRTSLQRRAPVRTIGQQSKSIGPGLEDATLLEDAALVANAANGAIGAKGGDYRVVSVSRLQFKVGDWTKGASAARGATKLVPCRLCGVNPALDYHAAGKEEGRRAPMLVFKPRQHPAFPLPRNLPHTAAQKEWT